MSPLQTRFIVISPSPIEASVEGKVGEGATVFSENPPSHGFQTRLGIILNLLTHELADHTRELQSKQLCFARKYSASTTTDKLTVNEEPVGVLTVNLVN